MSSGNSSPWCMRRGDTAIGSPDNCVQAVESRAAAIAQADVGAKRYPAIVLGPSRSSEGYMLYYLVQWLDEGE